MRRSDSLTSLQTSSIKTNKQTNEDIETFLTVRKKKPEILKQPACEKRNQYCETDVTAKKRDRVTREILREKKFLRDP